MHQDDHYVRALDFLKGRGCIDDWIYGFCRALYTDDHSVVRYLEENPLPEDEMERKNMTVVSGAADMFIMATYHKPDVFKEPDVEIFKMLCSAALYEYEKKEGKDEPAVTVKLIMPGEEQNGN